MGWPWRPGAAGVVTGVNQRSQHPGLVAEALLPL
jgi:hypothetical protein